MLKDEKAYELVLEEAMKPVDPFTVNLNKAILATYALIQENQGETGSTSMVPPRFTRLNRSKRHIETDEEEEHTYYLDPNMRYYFVIYIVHLLNIVYTAFAVPLQVGFKEGLGPLMIAIEALCLAESIVHIVLRMRTRVLIRGQMYSYSIRDIFRTYRENGFYFDVFGILPFNMIFIAAGVVNPLYVVVPLRLVRVLTVGNAAYIVSYLQLLNHNLSSPIHLMTIISCFFLLWHWISSVWQFVNLDCEGEDELTWERANEIEGKSLYVQYSFAVYYTLKLTAGAGSADAYAATNLERIISCLIVHVGDVLFAVIFGLIAAYASSLTSDMEEYLMQRKKVDEFADSFGITREHKARTEEYFSYMRSLDYRPIMYQKLKEQLPTGLAKEIVYEINKHVLMSVFKGFGSLNFLKKMAHLIEIVHYAPGDDIIQRGDIGEEMHFIIEGRAAFLAADKHTVIKRVEKGQYFGESALFIKKRREYFVRAETYACLCVLKKSVFEALIAKFSRLRGKVRRMAREYDRRVGNMVKCESESEEEARLDIISTLQGLKRHQSAADVREELESYTKKKVVHGRRKAKSRLNVIPAGLILPMHKESTFTVRKTRKLSAQSDRGDDEDEDNNPYEPLSELPPLGSMENNLMTNNLLIEDKTPEAGNKLSVRRAPSMVAKPQRRLSKLTLGKQLAISQNTGVRFEWTASRASGSAGGDDVKM
ncbi:MAG: cyclic nucleotide-binding domain-containing protein [Candidatus Pacebacteria bacterium]|nr:cyclic nucleotide-binding domain-containing protein [Candidatus Paceibacterota bacterium]